MVCQKLVTGDLNSPYNLSRGSILQTAGSSHRLTIKCSQCDAVRTSTGGRLILLSREPLVP